MQEREMQRVGAGEGAWGRERGVREGRRWLGEWELEVRD